MSYHEKDDCSTTKQLQLKEIRRKAEASLQENDSAEPKEATIAELLAVVNAGNQSPQSDVMRASIIQDLIDDDYDEKDVIN